MDIRQEISFAAAFLLGVFAASAPIHGQTLEGEPARALARQRGLTVRAVRPGGRVIELVGFVDGKPEYLTTNNSFAASTSSTDVARMIVSDLTLDGANVTMGVWDGGHVRDSHQEFGGRVIYGGDSTFTLSDHATHVAGTIIASGVHSNAKGMAPNGSLRSFTFLNDLGEMNAQNLRLSNHSYGSVIGWDFDGANANAWTWHGDDGFGLYSPATSLWDTLAFDKPDYLIVKSAGNDRGAGPAGGVEHYHDTSPNVFTDIHPIDGPYDCIPTTGTAKNILTIGAVEDIFGGWNQPSNVVMASFSSWGPTNDGRIKPDVVANGVELVSSTSGADDEYHSISGTSMACPAATGNAAVLLGYWNQLHTQPDNPPATRSATLKGLIIHTAREAGAADGPDFAFGWGLLDALNAAVGIKLDRYQSDAIQELTLYDVGTYEKTISNVRVGDPVKVSVCWTDPAQSPISPTDATTRALRNDLDLRVIHNATLTTYYPWTLNPANPSAAAVRTGDNDRDNVEVVEFTAVHAGDYTVRVTHKGMFLVNSHQDFTLFVNGWHRDVAFIPNTFSLGFALNHPDTAYHAVLLEGNYNENPTLSQPCTLFSSGGTVTIGS